MKDGRVSIFWDLKEKNISDEEITVLDKQAQNKINEEMQNKKKHGKLCAVLNDEYYYGRWEFEEILES